MDAIGITRSNETPQIHGIRFHITSNTRIPELQDLKTATPDLVTQQAQRQTGHPQPMDADNDFIVWICGFDCQDG